MVYLGPQKKLKGKKNIDGRLVDYEYDARILYTDTSNEMINILHKLGQPVKFIKERYNFSGYILSKGYAWQLIRLRDRGFVKFDELTLLQEAEYIEKKNQERDAVKLGLY